MPNNLPETESPDLREYLFVDNARVRMLLSQLQGGVPETSKSATSRSHRLSLGLKILSAERGDQRSSEDTIALSDLHVSMLEEDAEALNLLRDVSEEAREAEFWGRGGGRKRVRPGMLLRVTAPTQLMDPQSITAVWRNFNQAFQAESSLEFEKILDGINALYGEHLSLTVLPRGASSPTKAFVGVIDHRTGFAALDRGSLFARLGPESAELTTIMQVARVPVEEVSGWSEERLLADFKASSQQAVTAGRLDRSALDQFLTGIMKLTEEYGLQAAPLWPAMAVIPLAVYRQVPTFEGNTVDKT